MTYRRSHARQLISRVELARDGKALLGERGWTLFWTYGRVMGAPYQGQYVSGVPTAHARALLVHLAGGDSIPVNLMHRHLPQDRDISSLRLRDGELVMVFAHREEVA